MMYDELVKELRDCRNKAVISEYWWHITTEAADAIEDLIVALTASNEVIAKSKQQWIPVTERLPDVWKHVITFDEDDGVRVNWRCGDNVSWSMGYHVTHWMPLPEPPKDGEE